MAEDSGLCCCDLTPHPDDKLTWTGSRIEGSRYQLVSYSCHVEFIEAAIHTSAETDTVTVRIFSSDEPDAGTPDGDVDVNMWTLTLGKSEGSAAWTPDQFAGAYFPNGVFVEVISADTTAEANISFVYYRRDTYLPAIPETPNERRLRIWNCYKSGTPYADNFDAGKEGDDYADTSAPGSTPGNTVGEPIID